ALEGIVSKRSDAPYSSGRGRTWLKSKCINEQEIVIGGYTYQPDHPGVLGALLVGYYPGDDLVLAGKVGNGFTQEKTRQRCKKLERLRRPKPPFKSVSPPYRAHTVWVEPRLVAQVSFAEWTKDGALRHSAYHGLREDKPPKEVVREKEEP